MSDTEMTAERALAVLDGARECLRVGPKGHVSIGGEIEKARAYFAALVVDAARWQHARKLLTIDDIEGMQDALESFGGLVSEDECKLADEAIDAARSKGGAA